MYFVTSNDNKLKEYQEILGIKLERINLDLPESQGIETEDVGREKVLAAYRALVRPVFVEDTGLFFDDLNGFPGALIKHLIDRVPLERICKLIGNNKKVIARVCLAYCFDGKDVKFFIGETKGIITDSPRGKNGFGWDSIFIPDGKNETFAEMGIEEKNQYMRREAAKKFKEYLDKKGISN
ncbi:MAG: non-canonical purine NTP pyrophosphatase [Candidatus Paceibacterota bacterium]